MRDVNVSADNSYLKVKEIYFGIINSLRGWDTRGAFQGGIISAVVFVTFIKYISDRKDMLNLQILDLFEMLSKQYPSIIVQEELVEYMHNVEQQLGFSSGLLESFASRIKEDGISQKFAGALMKVRSLDFTAKERSEVCLDCLMETIEEIAALEKKRTGTSHTPRTVAIFMESICDIKDDMRVYDPCVGIGMSVSEIVRKHQVDMYVQDIQEDNAAVAEMLLIMNGMKQGRVQCNDTLSEPLSRTLNKKFDRIICEPPVIRSASYSTNNDYSLIDHIMYYPELHISNSWVFVQHIVSVLNDKGKAVVLVPMSLLTREGSYEEPRRRLIEDGYITGVVELPGGIMPATGVKYSILLLQKNIGRQKEIYFLDLSNGLWDEMTGENAVAENRIQQLAKMVTNQEIMNGKSRIAELSEIVANRYQLAVARYVQPEIDVERFRSDSAREYEKLEDLDMQYRELQDQFRNKLKDYNDYMNQ